MSFSFSNPRIPNATGVEEVMDSFDPSIAEIYRVLLAMQKNLECPICLEVMKEPVSTNCAHVFCRFCTLKLLSQKKSASQCPLCNSKVTQRSLREDIRFKQVIEGVLETIRAFEHDTGLKFSDCHCLPTKAVATSPAVSQQKQPIIESRGYRDRLKRVKEGRNGKATLLRRSSVPPAKATVTRRSLRKKSNAICLEIGSDSSEDLFKKAGTVRRVDFRSESPSQDDAPCRSPGPWQLPELSANPVASMNLLGPWDFSEEGLRSTEDTQATMDVVVEKRPLLALPDPCVGQHEKSDSRSMQKSGSHSLLSAEETRLLGQSTEPPADKQAGNATEAADTALSAENIQTCDLLCEGKETLLQPHASPSGPLSQISGGKLRRSMCKVRDWLSNSKKILSPGSSQDAHIEVEVPDLDCCLSDADSPLSWENGVMGEPGLCTEGCEDEKSVSKLVAPKIEETIFGRTYKRDRKSKPLWNEWESIQVPIDNVMNTPIRQTLGQKRKAAPELTPDDFIKRGDGKEGSKSPSGEKDTALKVGGQSLAPVDKSPVAEKKDTGLPAEPHVSKGMSALEADRQKIPCDGLLQSNSCDLKHVKKKRSSWSKRSRHSLGALQLMRETHSSSPSNAEIEIDSYPSSEEPRQVSLGQRQVRRSRRLQLQTEVVWKGSNPAQQQVEDGGQRQRGSSPSCVMGKDNSGLSSGLQKGRHQPYASLMGMEEGDAETVGTDPSAPCGEEETRQISLCGEQATAGCSPCCPAAQANFQESCSLLPFSSKGVEQPTSEDQQFTATPPPEKSALCSQITEGDGFCTGEVMSENVKVPKVDDKATLSSELTPEADDSELDTSFLQKIFSRCKRQSFLLHPSPVKEPLAESQRGLNVGQVEDSKAGCVKRLTRVTGSVSEERGKPIACEVGQDISVQGLASPTVPEHGSGADRPPTPILMQNPMPAIKKRTPPGMGGETINPDSSGTSLSPSNKMDSRTDCCQAGRAEDAENRRLATGSAPEGRQSLPGTRQSLSPEPNGGSMEEKSGTVQHKQLTSGEDLSTHISSSGLSKHLLSGKDLEQSAEGSHRFPQLSETPPALLGSATDSKESSPGLLEVDRKDVSAVFSKASQPSPFQRGLGHGNRSRSQSRSQGLVRTYRRLVRKLQSSSEESSADELPCFQALIFGPSASTPSQPTQEASAEFLPLSSSSSSSSSNPRPKDEAASLSQESECSVSLFSSQPRISEDFASKLHDSNPSTPAPISPVEVASPSRSEGGSQPKSRDSRELINAEQPKDGPREQGTVDLNIGEEAPGYESETSHLGDSSGLSSQSEILTTQQRDAMQSNLKELQRKMALLEAVLNQQGSQAGEESDVRGRETRSERGLALVSEAHSENQQASHLQECVSDGLLTALESPAPRRGLEPLVQREQNALEPGSAAKLSRGSAPSLRSAFLPPVVDSRASTSEEHVANRFATGLAKGPPAAAEQDTERSCAQGKSASSLAPITRASAGKGNSRGLPLNNKGNMALVASGLKLGELHLVQRFARKTKSTWSNKITDETTHVIMKTDEDLVCERTLKYFLGIAARKWVVSYHWIVQSLKEGRLLNEEDFEVRGDVINGRNHQGPKRARESPTGKLFQGLEICCYGPFTDMLPEQLEWMLKLCGANLVKQPHLFTCSPDSVAMVVVQPDAWVEDAGGQDIPSLCSGTIVTREWVLDSVACYQRRKLEDYVVPQV